jgi:phosphoribosylaminoimidazolecarboxamide formyltransferase/IMP cyclohydrolase
LRQHPKVLALPFKKGVKRQDQVNAADEYVRDEMTPTQRRQWETLFEEVPKMPTRHEKQEWLEGLQGVVLGSDGYIPFRDTIDCAAHYGVSYVVQPGGSLRDQDVTDACDAYDMAMSLTGVRLFHH